MSGPSTIRGRVRHEHQMVAVPREVRLAVFRRAPSGPTVAATFHVSPSTAMALLSPGGVVRGDVLERVRAELEKTG